MLTLARDERLRCWSHIDERSAGFFALGAAKASGLPVLVTCTSGTAAANLLPAVIEARYSGVPLIILTADRPPELRDIGAGQTIDQIKLYGDNVKWFCELGVPESSPELLRLVRALASRAYWTALGSQPGPVHLNLPLREPLVLDAPLPDAEPGEGPRAVDAPWVARRASATAPVPLPHPLVRQPDPGERAVIIAGDLGRDPSTGGRLAQLAALMNVPLLADPLSGARSGTAAVAHFDLILRDRSTAASLAPDCVYRLGDLPTSKPLRNWLDGLAEARHVLFSADDRWLDPVARSGTRVIAPA